MENENIVESLSNEVVEQDESVVNSTNEEIIEESISQEAIDAVETI